MMNKTNPPQRPKRAQRSDGRSTRAVVLEAAGKVFAERGFAEATSKEICERAGTNGAAVNYYFGGKEGLYEEVLIEAHRQMLSLEDLNRIITSEATPEEKLRVFLKHIIRTAMNASELWGIRIFLRELASPSPFVPKFITTAVFPKSQKLREQKCKRNFPVRKLWKLQPQKREQKWLRQMLKLERKKFRRRMHRRISQKILSRHLSTGCTTCAWNGNRILSA